MSAKNSQGKRPRSGSSANHRNGGAADLRAGRDANGRPSSASGRNGGAADWRGREAADSRGTAGHRTGGQTPLAPEKWTDACSPLASVGATRALLARHGHFAKKSMGQNFLVNDDVVRHICELADLQPTDIVVEVGPGIGTLTCALCPQVARVISIERDRDLYEVLDETCGDFDNFTLVAADAVRVRPDQLDPLPSKFVSNLPYGIAATVILEYFQSFASIQSATVMVQSEVADRIAAGVGTKNYGAYTVKLALLTQVTGRFQVAPGNFFPAPHVESSVIRLDRRSDLGLAPEEVEAASMMADGAFALRRKTIANSMRSYLTSRQGGAEAAARTGELLERAGIDPKRRGETLSLDEFITLGRAYLAL